MFPRVNASAAIITATKPSFWGRRMATQGQYVPLGKQWLGGKGWIIVSAVAAAAGAGFMFLNSESYALRRKKNTPLGSMPMTPNEFHPFRVESIRKVSPDSAVFRFELPDKDKPLEITPSSFLLTRAPATGSTPAADPVIRPYTPVSQLSDKGFFELLVKRYEGGPMSSHIHSLKPGDLLEVKGPIVKFDVFKAEPHDHFAMVAGGTGITPMYQIITALLNDPVAGGPNTQGSKPKMTLLFGNQSENDILLKSELDELAARHPDRLKIIYLVDKPVNKAAWSGPTGYVTKDLLKKHIPAPRDGKIKVFVCGPGPMVAAVCGPKAPDYSQGDLSGLLKDLEYTPDQVFKF